MDENPLLIGISGKICSGKDFLSEILKAEGYREINLDAIGHLALQHKQQEVCEAFPGLLADSVPLESSPAAASVEKTINRKKLGDLVFRKPAALHKLEEILHPYMRDLVLKELSMQGCDCTAENIVSGEHTKQMGCRTDNNYLLNAAILEKLGLLPFCNMLLWVQAPLWLRAWRARYRMSLQRFLARNWAQRNLCPPRHELKGDREYLTSHWSPQSGIVQKSRQICPVYHIKNHFTRKETALHSIRRQLTEIPQLQSIKKVR